VYVDNLLKWGRLKEARTRINLYKAKSGLYDAAGQLKTPYIGYHYYEGMYYLKSGMLDSAEICFRKLSEDSNCHLEECHGLLALYQQKRNADSIIKYVKLYSDAVDAQSNDQRMEIVHQMASMYNFQRYQKIAADKERSAERQSSTHHEHQVPYQ